MGQGPFLSLIKSIGSTQKLKTVSEVRVRYRHRKMFRSDRPDVSARQTPDIPTPQTPDQTVAQGGDSRRGDLHALNGGDTARQSRVALAGQYRPAWTGRGPPPQSPPPPTWPRLASHGHSLCRRYGHAAPRRGDASGPPHQDRNLAPTCRLTAETE